MFIIIIIMLVTTAIRKELLLYELVRAFEQTAVKLIFGL